MGKKSWLKSPAPPWPWSWWTNNNNNNSGLPTGQSGTLPVGWPSIASAGELPEGWKVKFKQRNITAYFQSRKVINFEMMELEKERLLDPKRIKEFQWTERRRANKEQKEDLRTKSNQTWQGSSGHNNCQNEGVEPKEKDGFWNGNKLNSDHMKCPIAHYRAGIYLSGLLLPLYKRSTHNVEPKEKDGFWNGNKLNSDHMKCPIAHYRAGIYLSGLLLPLYKRSTHNTWHISYWKVSHDKNVISHNYLLSMQNFCWFQKIPPKSCFPYILVRLHQIFKILVPTPYN